MIDRPLTYRETVLLFFGVILSLGLFFGGVEFVRHHTQLCDQMPEVIINACWGR